MNVFHSVFGGGVTLFPLNLQHLVAVAAGSGLPFAGDCMHHRVLCV